MIAQLLHQALQLRRVAALDVGQTGELGLCGLDGAVEVFFGAGLLHFALFRLLPEMFMKTTTRPYFW